MFDRKSSKEKHERKVHKKLTERLNQVKERVSKIMDNKAGALVHLPTEIAG